MWNEISTVQDLHCFMDMMCSFHDSCIKELKYLSGAYVNNDLAMYPVNDRRVLRVIIQRQFEINPMIEMEFEGLKYLKLFPTDDKYTCEILSSTMVLKNECVYWCDRGNLSEEDLENFKGTMICATKFRWRPIKECMGETSFYYSILQMLTLLIKNEVKVNACNKLKLRCVNGNLVYRTFWWPCEYRDEPYIRLR